ncbi:MAG: porphobilinogen synthase [Methanomicrobiales archaeon]|nr:porphobilinogen synthase [Methanomicrobiales archaeon]
MFPRTRMRRLRRRNLQLLFKEFRIFRESLIAPLFVDENLRGKIPVPSMPGVFRYAEPEIPDLARRLYRAGIRAILLFGIPRGKSENAEAAYAEDGIVQRSIRAVRKAVPEMVICTDVCACEYTTHGHCGIVGETAQGMDVLNDVSLDLMAAIAVSHARAGADIVAPSCMLDGVVFWTRAALDENGFEDVLILSYSTKFASALYGPFREAADSGYSFGDRTTYQLPPSNAREAFRESELDVGEGADLLMVKPAGWYLDVLARIKSLGLPVAAYQVSGEYAMIKAAAEKGWIDERKTVLESLISLQRAGADLIITYYAEQVAGWLDEE